jgi:recombination protein RecT
MSAAIEKKPQQAVTPVDRQMLGIMAEFGKRDARLEKLLPPGSDVERFKEGIRFALAQNPDLLRCSPGSIMLACMKAAKLGVDVSGGALGHGHLVPYGEECTFVQGYKGLVALAVQSGVVKDMQPVNVHENDTFDIEEGESPRFTHKPFVPRKVGQERGGIIASYTRVLLADGTRVIKGLLYLDDIARIESGIRAKKSPWNTPHRPEMVKKSSVKNAFKTLGIPEGESTDRLRRALEADAEAELVDAEYEQAEPAKGVEGLKSTLKRKTEEQKALPSPTPSFADLDAQLAAARSKAPVPITNPDAEPPEDMVLPGQRQPGEEE